MTDYCLVYITAKDINEAKSLAKDLLVNKLVACANIRDGYLSMYWWQDQIMEDSEVVLFAKTKKENFEKIEARVKELHSYDCPCVISLPIEKGSKEFLSWLEGELQN